MTTTHASKPLRQPKTILAPPAAPLAGVTTIGDLLKGGNIPAGRVRLHPTPGTATAGGHRRASGGHRGQTDFGRASGSDRFRIFC